MCGNDCIYEDNEPLQKALSIMDLRDKCDRISGLLQCLQWVVETEDFQHYTHKPHQDLFSIIEDEVKIIEKSLSEM